MISEEDAQEWVEAGQYRIQWAGEEVRVRNSSGKLLSSVPSKVKDLPAYVEIEARANVVRQHSRTCADTVRSWMLGSNLVPTEVLKAVWTDPYWRRNLENLVIHNAGSEGEPTGLLRRVDENGAHLVDLDGESYVLNTPAIVIPHPVLIKELDQWREFASELGAVQGCDQLFRQTHAKPHDIQAQRAVLGSFEGAFFSRAADLIGRGRGGGFTMGLDSAEVTVTEEGRRVCGKLDIDAYEPTSEAYLGRLHFETQDRRMDLAEVGPVAWSEAIRMCEFLYTGRDDNSERSK